jgi:hypothetical protein
MGHFGIPTQAGDKGSLQPKFRGGMGGKHGVAENVHQTTAGRSSTKNDMFIVDPDGGPLFLCTFAEVRRLFSFERSSG